MPKGSSVAAKKNRSTETVEAKDSVEITQQASRLVNGEFYAQCISQSPMYFLDANTQ